MKRFDRIVYFFLAMALPISCTVQCIAGDGTCRELESVIEARSGDVCLAEGGE